MALFWLIGAAVFSLTALGRPLSRAAIEMAGLSLSPFGRDAVHIRELGGQDPAPSTAAAGPFGLLFNLLWMFTFGLLLFTAYVILGAACCLTVRGHTLGLQCFRLAAVSLWPIGRRVVSTDIANVTQQRKTVVERFAHVQLRETSRCGRTDRPTSAPRAAAQ